MPRRCVVGGCSNIPDGRGRISVHRFPKAKRMRKIWINFVNNTRSDFACTDNSVICSNHFTEECFDPSFAVKLQFGLDSRGRTLLDGEYPSIKCKAEPEDKVSLKTNAPSNSITDNARQ
ncbi:THAP domain-containing protein 10 [Holothuria leucospilota]|uniref:THAP domain-containing protein 10 n=1 Tax=Holothuria leucospilota TaxID=206669 RepID=A0A9Q1CMP3_HOLLE|nr:THAP domain-containing protein 10 [Holothuria leucospilota]